MEKLTLQQVLEAFNAPINEEQAWAVCYQCTKHLQGNWRAAPEECFRFNRTQCVEIGKDGNIVDILPCNESTPDLAETEYDLVQSVGVVVFQALDYGLGEEEEQKLSPALETLLEKMTGSESDDEADNPALNEGEADEGIEHDAEDEELMLKSNRFTFDDVLKMCTSHLASSLEATAHYKAVCRAVVAEAQELHSFLEKISKERDKLRSSSEDCVDGSKLDELQRHDWARLWMQIMRELRNGVKLKKVDLTHMHSMEFELTPYEILMEDIRSRRYSLKQVMVNGDIPATMKKDAHDIILEFIRSRPPLHPAKDRVLASPPPRTPDAREEMLQSIRSEPKLKPTPGRTVETSRTKLDEEDEIPAPTRKVIKVDPSLFMSNSFDEDDDDDDDDDENESSEKFAEDRNKVAPSPLSPLTPLASPDTPLAPAAAKPWQQAVYLWEVQRRKTMPHLPLPRSTEMQLSLNIMRGPGHSTSPAGSAGPAAQHHGVRDPDDPDIQVALDIATQQAAYVPERRHSITVCESPTTPRKAGHPPVKRTNTLRRQNASFSARSTNGRPFPTSLECLSLTIEEVMHIRSVLTKAELECLIVDPELQSLLAKGKICFTCKQTKFSLFGQWATKCKFCRRSVCSKCCSKMRIPTEHFEHIPVYTLSPSPMSPNGGSEEVSAFTYENLISLIRPGSVPSSPDIPRKDFSPAPDVINNNRRRAPMQRSMTLGRPQTSRPGIQGPLMNVCTDCKAMVLNIIRASRTSLANAPDVVRQRFPIPEPPSHKAERNFHLELKPVYKT